MVHFHLLKWKECYFHSQGENDWLKYNFIIFHQNEGISFCNLSIMNKFIEKSLNIKDFGDENTHRGKICIASFSPMMTSYLTQSFIPLGSGNIISSHKKMWKCPISPNEISTNLMGYDNFCDFCYLANLLKESWFLQCLW